MSSKYCIFVAKIYTAMNIQYISGFFDADGYISLLKSNKNDIAKHVVIGFTNTEKTILCKIQDFLMEQYSLKGIISSKKPVKEIHKIGYDLKYHYNDALKLAELLISFHPKKNHRINLSLLEYKTFVKRNGKYSIEELRRLKEFEDRFFN